MRILHYVAQVNADAKLAVDLFCYTIAKQLAAMAAALNGEVAIVFTGVVDENDALIRADICSKLAFLNLSIDTVKNQTLIGDNKFNRISGTSSSVVVGVVKTQVNVQIARHAWALFF